MSSIATFEPSKPQVSADAALRIARLDAEQKYRDLSPYRIAIVFEDNHWRIEKSQCPRRRPALPD